MNNARSLRLSDQCNKVALSVHTFETAGTEHLAQAETNQSSNIMTVFVVVSSGVDVNSCSSIVSHAVAHTLGNVGNDSLVGRLQLQETLNDNIKLDQQLAILLVGAV